MSRHPARSASLANYRNSKLLRRGWRWSGCWC